MTARRACCAARRVLGGAAIWLAVGCARAPATKRDDAAGARPATAAGRDQEAAMAHPSHPDDLEAARSFLGQLNQIEREHALHGRAPGDPLLRSGELNARVQALKDEIQARGFRAEWNGTAYELRR
jgi:hypothetical protein